MHKYIMRQFFIFIVNQKTWWISSHATGIVELHVDLFSRPQKMTLIILHSRQEGSIHYWGPWTNMAATNVLYVFIGLQPPTDI